MFGHKINTPKNFFHEKIDWNFPSLDQDLPKINILSSNAYYPHYFDYVLEHFKTMGSIESGLMGTLGSICLITFCLTLKLKTKILATLNL